MSKHFTFSLFGLAFIVFFVWIIVAGSPLERINRGCSPIVWGGKVASSVTDIFSDSAAQKVWHGTAYTFQGCRFAAFKTFYQSEYQRLQAERAREAANTRPAGHKVDVEASAK
ncbi:hypothetical protein AB7849_15315 [Rhodanobacter sp. 115]|uniref:hypothetical protein n=1 Tax=Rhodanobacter sp. FW021-MT20 TaxID=1162282 RepID=UPI0034E46731